MCCTQLCPRYWSEHVGDSLQQYQKIAKDLTLPLSMSLLLSSYCYHYYHYQNNWECSLHFHLLWPDLGKFVQKMVSCVLENNSFRLDAAAMALLLCSLCVESVCQFGWFTQPKLVLHWTLLKCVSNNADKVKVSNCGLCLGSGRAM